MAALEIAYQIPRFSADARRPTSLKDLLKAMGVDDVDKE